MNQLSPAEMIAAVERWQTDPSRQALLCAREAGHRPLEAVDGGGAVVLCCPDCQAKQIIPRPVLDAFEAELTLIRSASRAS